MLVEIGLFGITGIDVRKLRVPSRYSRVLDMLLATGISDFYSVLVVSHCPCGTTKSHSCMVKFSTEAIPLGTKHPLNLEYTIDY